MASAHLNELARWYGQDSHPVWYRSFSEHQRDNMVEDDLSAGYGIPAILISIVLFGLASMALSVFLAL